MSASDVYTNYTPSVPGVSDDGRFVSFISQSNLLPGSNGTPQGYIYDFDFYQPYHVSRNGLTGSASNVSGLVLSAGGNFCAFTTAANSGLTSERQPYSGVFRHELQPGYTFTLTGTMNYAGWSGPNALPQLTLQFRQGTGATISKNVTCQPDGSFTLDMVLPTLGNWDIFGKSFTTLRKKAGTFDFTGANLNVGTINLLNGDSVDDNVVDLSDYTVIVSRFNSVETDFSWQARADLNGDKVVDLTDYTIIVVNFNAIGE